MRPCRSTWVASTTRSEAPELANMPRWTRCHSLAQPSSALYWHIGETTMRLDSSSSASRIGENNALIGWGSLWLGRLKAWDRDHRDLTGDFWTRLIERTDLDESKSPSLARRSRAPRVVAIQPMQSLF